MRILCTSSMACSTRNIYIHIVFTDWFYKMKSCFQPEIMDSVGNIATMNLEVSNLTFK